MTEPRQYDGGAGTAHSSPVQQPGQSSSPAGPSGSQRPSDPKAGAVGQTGGEAVAGPFTLRETVIGVSVLVMFIGTILPFFEGVNLWMTFSLFFLGIGILLPVAALALLVGRRMGSKNLRVGSLSVDQFASVAAGFAAAFFFLQTVTTFGIGQFVALLGSVGFLVATIGGPHLGIFKPDFTGRPSSSAHLIAREALPAKPREPKPVPAEQVGSWQGPAAGSSGSASPAPGASAGPSSAGHSAGYAVAGYAAGHQATPHPSGPAGSPAAKAPEGAASASASKESEPSSASPQQPPASEGSASPEASEGHERPEVRPGAAATDAEEQEAKSADASAGEGTAPSGEASHAPTMAHPRIEGSQPDQGSGSGNESQAHPRTESISATREAEEEGPVVEAFWFAVGTPRVVTDEHTGAQLFVLQPGDWEVGIEDRGHEFLVQDKRTGRIGVMRDLRNIERAPREG